MQGWIAGLKLHPNSARQVITDVSQVFTAAVDDHIISRNPLSARSIQRPKPLMREASAWTYEQVSAVADALPARLSAMVPLGAACGHRQAELFGVAVDDLDFLRKMIHVEVQVKYVDRCLVFAPVKNRKTRDVPVADPVVSILAEHVRLHPPVSVTLPWMTPDGKPITRRLLFTRPDGKQHYKGSFNTYWRRAWRKAGIPEAAEPRIEACHARVGGLDQQVDLGAAQGQQAAFELADQRGREPVPAAARPGRQPVQPAVAPVERAEDRSGQDAHFLFGHDHEAGIARQHGSQLAVDMLGPEPQARCAP